MKFLHLAAAAIFVGAAAGFIWPAQADTLPMDKPVTVDGIDVACSGIGEDAKENPLWKTYPIRVEFSNGGAQYLSGAHVTLSQGGKTLTSFDCSGAWVLFRNLHPGTTYTVAATITGQPGAGEKSASFKPPSSGQRRVVLQYPIEPGQ